MAFPLMPGFLFSALTVPCNFCGWSHTGTCRPCSGGAIDGSNIHNSARTEGSSGEQAPDRALSIHSSLPVVCRGRGRHCSCLWGREDQGCSYQARTYQACFSCALPFGDGGLNCGGYLRTVICPGGLFGNLSAFLCSSRSRAGIEDSKKWGMLFLVNQLFKIYFKVGFCMDFVPNLSPICPDKRFV